MINRRLKLLLSILLLNVIFLSSVLARDVSNEQYMVTEAQKDYDKAKADYDETTVMANDQKRRVEQDQALLKEREKAQATAKAQLTKAQGLLDKRQKELNQAWNKGGH
ncbi:hypothetical protein GALL_150110 [mine drainage metagenome]|uniref:Uncharacterized protein n=1 Tax=mine drainage metagenome TaxID=410659 RepID=A0A1J5S489_9ZZZZ